jgi:hypothetical protein
MTPADAEQLVDEFIKTELKALLDFAFDNYSGGEKLDDAVGHFAAGCDHLIAMRAKVLAIIVDKFEGKSP